MNINPSSIVSSENSLTLPAEIVEKLGLKSGDTLNFADCGGCVVLKRVPTRAELELWACNLIADLGDEVMGVSVDGREVLVRAQDGRETAFCHPNDEFSLVIGIAVALAKIYDDELPYGLETW